MRKAVPVPAHPRSSVAVQKREEWERAMDNYDRVIRRREKKYRQHVVRIDHLAVALITSDRRLPLDGLNALVPIDETSSKKKTGALKTRQDERSGNVAISEKIDRTGE